MKALLHTKLNNTRGMTLVEILIVLAIVGSIMAVIGGKVMTSFQKSKVKQTGIIMSQLSSALNIYYSDCSKMPQSLKALIESPGDAECADWGPESYVKKDLLKDAWGTDFVYESDGSNFKLKSLGKDRREGGSKFDKDLAFDEKDSSEEK
jgi:general secretion pathway protein G